MFLALWSSIFILSLAVLIASAKTFTRSSEKISHGLGVSSFLTGMFVLTLATALPELLTSIVASSRGYTSMVASNLISSNIANLLLIGGLVMVVAGKINNDQGQWVKQVPFFLCTTFLTVFMVMDGDLSRLEAGLLTAVFVLYTAQSYELYKAGLWELLKEKFTSTAVDAKLVGTFVFSLALVLSSAYFTIESIVKISEEFGWVPSVLGGSALALGTSLPELITALTAARQKNLSLAMGNLVGSCIFNFTLVMGVSGLIAPLDISLDVLTISLAFLLVGTLLLVFLSYQKTWARYEGALMILLYLVFLVQFLNPSFS